MARKNSSQINFSEMQTSLKRQFSNLDRKDPSLWPALPRLMLCIAIIAIVTVLAWFLWLKDYEEALKQEQAKEETLREEYRGKLVKAVSLDALKKQREQVQQYVTQLEKQLPSKAEMSALLSDINQAGLGRSLQFETFRPGQVVVKDYYAELPISIRVSGKYHDMGEFAADIANLSRIVTLNNLTVGPSGARDGSNALVMDATAKTFRYLDQEEILAQRKAAGVKK